jgi:hypothetical protein
MALLVIPESTVVSSCSGIASKLIGSKFLRADTLKEKRL